MTLEELLPVIAIMVSVLGLTYQHFAVLSRMKDDMTRVKERLAALETKTGLFWNMVEKKMSKLLMSFPTNIPKDELLLKFSEGRVTLDEAETLRCMLILEEEQGEVKGSPQALIYLFIIERLNQIIREAAK